MTRGEEPRVYWTLDGPGAPRGEGVLYNSREEARLALRGHIEALVAAGRLAEECAWRVLRAVPEPPDGYCSLWEPGQHGLKLRDAEGNWLVPTELH